MIECSADGQLGILPGAEKVLSDVFMSALTASNDWGHLNDSPNSRKMKQNFLDGYDSFLQFMSGECFEKFADLTSINKCYFVPEERV